MNSEKSSAAISNLTRGLARVRLTHVALGAILMLAAAVTVQLPKAWAQAPGGGRGAGAAPQPANPNGMHVYIWSGLKTHNIGQHDYPQFLADWSKVLTEKGAVVDGALHAPSAAELEHTDVVVLYKGDVTLGMPDAEK